MLKRKWFFRSSAKVKTKESLKTSVTSNRIRVVAHVDLRVVGKTLVARGFISYTSSTLMRMIFSKTYRFLESKLW